MKYIESYIGIFEGNLSKMKKNIKENLKKRKDKKTRALLKNQLAEAKKLQKTIKKIKKATAKRCPHCNGIL